MILISHPRSGSEMLLRGAVGIKYNQIEIFNEANLQTSIIMKPISYGTRLCMLKTMGPAVAHKIHSYHLRYLMQHQFLAPEILEYLQSRDDVYFLKRENMRKSIVSEFIAMSNNNNYHEPVAGLRVTTPFAFTTLTRIVESHLVDTMWAESLFTFKEKFTMEGLLNGSNLPKTFEFDMRQSNTVKRDSWAKGFIPNLEQVDRWMDLLKVPGDLEEVWKK